MMNQKVVHKFLYGLQKALEVIYFFGSLWIGIVFICTIPLWAPFYLMTVSMYRSLNFMKKVIELPTDIIRPRIIEPIRYAILKKNGKYLRGETEDPLLSQLYDYTLRRFLSVQQIQAQMKIAEIECETVGQWSYFVSKGIKNLTCLQSHPQILQREKETHRQIDVIQCCYDIDEFSNQYDSIIALNLKQKLNKYINRVANQKCQKIDLLQILAYIKHHLAKNGYAVIGDYFQDQGEVKVLEELFKAYGFKVQQSEDIQKNIIYAQKLLSQKPKKFWEDQLLEKFVNKVKRLLGTKKDYSRGSFVVFIISKEQFDDVD